MIKQRRERWFQLTWAALHASAALLHLGSALYHVRRMTDEGTETDGDAEEERPPRKTLPAYRWNEDDYT